MQCLQYVFYSQLSIQKGVSKQSPGPLNSTVPLGSEIPASATASVSTHLYMGLQVESIFVSPAPPKKNQKLQSEKGNFKKAKKKNDGT